MLEDWMVQERPKRKKEEEETHWEISILNILDNYLA